MSGHLTGVALAWLGLASSAAALGEAVRPVEELRGQASDAGASDGFGSAAALSGDTAVIGSPLHDLPAGVDAGAAYVLVREPSGWVEEAKLVAPDAAPGDRLGVSVSISGDTIVVGAPQDDALGLDSGSARVFERSGTTWTQTVVLLASDGAAGDLFGTSVAVSGDTIAVGAPSDDDAGSGSGAAYVFERSGSSWSESAKLGAADGAAGNELGVSVALEGDTLLVGARLGDGPGPANSGSVYVFRRAGSVWSEETELVADDAQAGDEFGLAVALSGDRALVGAPGRTPRGTAYAFERSGTSWSLADRLNGTALSVDARYGSAVAVDGDRALVGAPFHDGEHGFAFLLVREGTGWEQFARLRASAPLPGLRFGSAVAIDGQRFVTGAPLEDEPAIDAGSAYLWALRPSTEPWRQASVISPVGPSNDFGYAIAACEDRMLVRARFALSSYVFTRSGSTWIQEAVFGSVWDSVALSSDTALVGPDVYVRSGTSWSLQATLPPGAAGAFGHSVALEGDTALVGAHGQAGSHPGEAYVFVRSGTSWSLEATLTAVPWSSFDYFGWSAALSGDTALVGTKNGGVAFVFVRNGSTWTQQQRLAPPPGTFGNFGYSVALSGDTALVGNPNFEMAYVFGRTGTTWALEGELASPDPGFTQFGWSVALSGDKAFAGGISAHGAEGSVSAFQRSGTTWSAAGELVTLDGAGLDRFGASIALSGDAVLVGAWGREAAYEFLGSDPYPSFCDASDGALASCPCGNAGNPDSGCDIQSQTGGVRLNVVLQSFLPQNRATIAGTGFAAMGTPTVLPLRATALDAASPVVFGDGLRCVGLPAVRLAATFATGGASAQTIGHGSVAGPGAFYYQLWFRDQPAMFCTPDAFNLSNGRTIRW